MTEHAPEKPWQTPVDQLDPAARAELELVQLSPVRGGWAKEFMGVRQLTLGLGRESGITGALGVAGDKVGVAEVRNIQVDERLRGQSLGKRLLQSFAAEVKRAGAQSLEGHINSELGLRNRLQTFGAENVALYDEDDPERMFTPEQASETLRLALEKDPDATIGASVDLNRIDMSEWELPFFEDDSRRAA